MKSMDSVRYVPGTEDDTEFTVVSSKSIIQFYCPKCDGLNSFEIGEIDKFIESEERDPDIEYFVCMHCHEGLPITNGVINGILYVVDDRSYITECHRGKIESDGYFTYFIFDERKLKLN